MVEKSEFIAGGGDAWRYGGMDGESYKGGERGRERRNEGVGERERRKRTDRKE